MNATLLNRLGEWNPQFHREIKGKMTRQNVILTVLISLFIQGFLILVNSPTREGLLDVDWESIFYALNGMLPACAIAIGVYLLSSDLCREQERGTLNFVRLSPQPSESILLGKLLGVPILLYLGIALMLPLHLFTGANFIARFPAGKAFFVLFGAYPIWVALGGIYYSVAMLLALTSRQEDLKFLPATTSLVTIVTAGLTIARPVWMFYPGLNGTGWNWFFLPESFVYPWLLATLFAVNLWIWQIVNRRFRNLHQTAIAKAQSYWIVGCTQLWLMGFALPDALSGSGSAGAVGTFCLFAIAPILIFIVTLLLLNSRQNILDWARYRPRQKAEKRALLRDLLFGEKSPAPVAIALNLLITAAIWLPWIVLLFHSLASSDPIGIAKINAPAPTALRFALSLVITAIALLIYATLYQRIRFQAKDSKQERAIARP